MLDKVMDSVKTMKGWQEYADSHDRDGGFDSYCKPGDYVSEDIFDYFLNVLPPHRWSKGYLQAGEPVDYRLNRERGMYQDTWTTFVIGPKIEGKQLWEYRGNFARRQGNGGEYDGIRAYKQKLAGDGNGSISARKDG